MSKIAVKNLWARKFRALATTVAVVLGIAFVSGTYVLTDSINTAFDEIFTESLGVTDVVVSAEQPVSQDTGEVPSIPAEVLSRVQQVDGVEEAVGEIFTTGAFFTVDDDRIGAPFAPQFIASKTPERFSASEYAEGRAPRDASEAALDTGAASSAGLEVGDRMQIAAAEPATEVEIVGLFETDGVSFGGTSVAVLTRDLAERLTDRADRFDAVYAVAAEGLSAEQLRDRVAGAVGPGLEVETETEWGERQSSEIKDSLGFLRVALLVFAGIALFVGAFLIFNTFSITVAQRTREFGLLRTLGASRRQILGTVIAEALLIGLLGSVAGLFGGLAVAAGLTELLALSGAELPSAGVELLPRTAVICLVLGLAVTLVSAFFPAIRSTRVTPMAAMLATELEPVRRRRWIPALLASVLGAAGLGAIAYGLIADNGTGTAAGMMGGGAVAVVLAVSLFSARLVGPVAVFAGAPLVRLGGMPGRLARENSQRKPGRTAVTAAALMIGITVVTFFAVFSSGLKATVSDAVDESFQGELVLTTSDFTLLSPQAAERAAEVDGVETVAALRYSQAEVRGTGRRSFTGLVPSQASEVLSFDWVEGSSATLEEMTDEQVVVTEGLAAAAGAEVGERIEVLTQTGEEPVYEVVGVISDELGLFGHAIVTRQEMIDRFGATSDMIDFVGLAEGADPERVQAAVRAELEEAFPTIEVLNQAELKEQQESSIDQILYLVYALVGLAILVSLFGIANTLALSIHERIRELGMLRAIGMTRRQVRRMIRYEAVITAMIGALLGVALGAGFAALISVPLAEEGFVLSYPVPALLSILALAALAGVLSAVPPARRASRIDLLEAVSHE